MDSLKLIKMLTPEIVDMVEGRYSILKSISSLQPVGRRLLAEQLNVQERTIRNEANILKEQGLIKIEATGMSVTDKGEELLKELHTIYIHLKGIPELEKMIQKELNVKKITIVPSGGKNKSMLKDLGIEASRRVKEITGQSKVIGITGGTTMASVASECIKDNRKRDLTVVPARGGLGRNIYTQANSIAVSLAEKLGGDYRLLYVPDGLSEEALDYMKKNEDIKETLDLIESMDTLIFSIARADVMVARRKLKGDVLENLQNKGAVAEAFGHYFDISGNEVWEYKTIGISLKKFKNIDIAIGVAGGEEKAEAIVAIASLNKNMELVIDELAAKKILEIKAKKF